MAIQAGYAGFTSAWNDDYTVQTLTYIQPSGAPVKPTFRMPYVKLRRTYNADGRVVREEYLKSNGKRTANSAYVYGRAYEYDDFGRTTKWYTFDKDGKVTGGRSRVAYALYRYDSAGKATITRYDKLGHKVN